MTERGGLFRRRMVTLTVAFALAFSLLPSHGAQATAARRARRSVRPAQARRPSPSSSPVHGPTAAKAFGRSSILWSDLDKSTKWAKEAINYVGAANEWMRDFAPNPDGTYPFQPTTIETRKYFARAVVMALAPDETVDPTITFADLDPSDAFYPAANIAVKLHWMKKTAAGDVRSRQARDDDHGPSRADAGARARARDQVAQPPPHRRRRARSTLPPNFGALILGMRLGLRYNSSNEANDVAPTTPLSRAQVAYSLYRAVTQPSWNVPSLIEQYQDIELPALTPDQAADRPVGRRSTWASPTCGVANGGSRRSSYGQPVPGFDCSGFTWWLLRASDDAYWHVSPPRPYLGWDLPQRTSARHGDGRQAHVREAAAGRPDVLRRRRRRARRPRRHVHRQRVGARLRRARRAA